MPRFRTIKNSFLGGQISQTSVGRTDLPQYPHSCEILQNMIPVLSGGAYRRPGTLFQDQLRAYAAATHTSGDRPPRLIPFIVSRNEAYALLLGVNGVGATGYVQAYRATGNGPAQVQIDLATGTTPYKPNLGLPNSLGTFDDDVWSVQYTQSNDIMWLTHPTYKPQVVRRTALDIFTVGNFDAGLSGLALAQAYPYLNQNATSTTMAVSATSGAGVTLTCSTAYFNNLQIGAIFAIQTGTTSPTLGFIQITATAGTTGSPSTTATGTTLTNFGDTSAHVTWWESAWSNYRGWPRSTCIFQQRLAFGGTTPSGGETLDPLNIPAGQPDSIWFAETANYFKFTALGDTAPYAASSPYPTGATGVLANGQNFTTAGNLVVYRVDDSQGDGQSIGPIGIQPFRITLADSQLDSIQWMSPDQQILIGTLNEEWVVAPVNGSFDVANSIATIQSHYGSDFLPATRIGYELVFAMKSQTEVRAYQYNYFDQSFFGEPVQLFFDEYPQAENGSPFSLGRRKFRQLDWDVTRSTLWCTDTAGNFFGMTRDRKLQVTMWHTHQLGGFNTAQGIGTGAGLNADPAWFMCDGSVVSFASVPNPSSGFNDVWMVVKRTINNIVQWQIERMIGTGTVRNSAYQSVFPGQGTEPYLVDSASLFTFADWDGTDNNYTVGAHSIGQTLTGTYYSSVWGIFQIGLTGAVSGGGVATLATPLPPDYAVSGTYVFTLGLPYTPIIQTVRVDSQGQIGTTMGAIKRISKVYLWIYKALGLTCGSPPGETVSAPAQVQFKASSIAGQSPEIYSGEKHVFFPAQYDRNGRIYITQTQPFPLYIASLIAEGEEYEQ